MKLLNRKGFAALFITLLILVVVFGIIISLTVLSLNQQRISRNLTASSQAYYTAQAGIEDALIRIKNRLIFSQSYGFEVGDSLVLVEISDNIGGVRTITSSGNVSDRIRKIQVNYGSSSVHVSFYYGAQAGEGGVIMRNNSLIKGNVFSNGSILGSGRADITDSVIVAGEKIDNVKIGGDAKVYNCYNSTIQGDLFYVIGGTVNCDIVGISDEIGEINKEDFPISEEVINDWKKEAEQTEEVIFGNYDVGGIDFLGPVHIQGDLTLKVNSTLKMQGIILVSGDLKIENNAVLELDENYYHSLSGVLIVEGKVVIRPGGTVRGLVEQGSYIMIVSLNDCLENAVQIDNTSDGGIFFVPYGTILLNQNIKIREATAYKIILRERAEIEYEIGLEDVFFSSGKGGGWEILNWKEIE